MIRVGAYEAKTRLSELLDRAEKGEVFEITKNGRPVAKLSPLGEDARREQVLAAVESIKARLARGPRVSPEESQRDWEALKRALEEEEDEELRRIDP